MRVSSKLILLPAVDIRAGKSVRLSQGRADSEEQYADPLESARTWQEAGAEWIHLVDLDAAFGTGNNLEVLKDVIASVEVRVQVSGGISDERMLEAALAMGATRINLSTASLRNIEWVEQVVAEFGDLIAVGLDVHGKNLIPRGSRQDVGELMETLERLNTAGCARYILTDVSRDGSLQGPNIDLLREVCDHTSVPVIASGGVSSLADIDRLRELVDEGLEGAIVGKALYVGAFSLPEALRRADGR